MGGSSVVDDRVVPSSTPRTLVLVGCTGNGKSATGNSILQAQSSGVTQTCQMHTTVSKDGLILSVIDAPGLFDCSVKTEFTVKEIAKCINMAKNGVDAVLVVLSVKSRFSVGEELVLNSLRTLFGNNLANYMIIVFTGGDDLEYDEKTLEDYLGQNCPKPLQEGATELGEQIDEATKHENEEQLLIQLTEKVELKFKESISNLEQQLAKERAKLEQQLAKEKAARLNAEKMIKTAEKTSREQIQKMKENQESVERQLRDAVGRINCVIQ